MAGCSLWRVRDRREVGGGGEQDIGAGGTAINTHLVNGTEHVWPGPSRIDFGGSTVQAWC